MVWLYCVLLKLNGGANDSGCIYIDNVLYILVISYVLWVVCVNKRILVFIMTCFAVGMLD